MNFDKDKAYCELCACESDEGREKALIVLMTTSSKIPEPPVVEEEKVPEVLKIEMTADKQTINCEADQKLTLKINVTNKGTVISPALTLQHEYTNEKGEDILDDYDVCQAGEFIPGSSHSFSIALKAQSKGG